MHGCYFAVGARLSNFCHSFSYTLGHLQFKNGESLKTGKSLENLSFVMAAQAF